MACVNYRQQYFPQDGICILELEMADKVEIASDGLIAEPCASKYDGKAVYAEVSAVISTGGGREVICG